MAEPNGANRIDDHELRLAKLGAARRELEDSFIVMAHLETKAAARIKEHAEFIAEQEARLRSHSEFMEGQQAAMRLHTQKMTEFDEKLNALIDSVGKMQGGMETRPS
jgi:uncharacterized coiled-coil protein SlyX